MRENLEPAAPAAPDFPSQIFPPRVGVGVAPGHSEGSREPRGVGGVCPLWTQRRIAGRETVIVSAFCFGAFPWRHCTIFGVDNRRGQGDFSVLVPKISKVSREKRYSLVKAQHCR